MQTAMGHFQNERLSIPGCIVRLDQHSCTSCEIAWFDVRCRASRCFVASGFSPLPAVPTAWAGKIPDLATLKQELQDVLKTLTVRADGSLAIPADSDVPVEMNAPVQDLLTDLRQRFPKPVYAAPEKSASGSVPSEGAPAKFNTFEDADVAMSMCISFQI